MSTPHARTDALVPEPPRATGFEQVRLGPGTRVGGGVIEAAAFLIRPDTREFPSHDITQGDAEQNIDEPTLKLLQWLIRIGLVVSVTAQGHADHLVLVLHLAKGHSNPALSLLNQLRERNGEKVLSGVDIATLANISNTDAVPHPNDKSTNGARLVDKIEELLLAAINKALSRANEPGA